MLYFMVAPCRIAAMGDVDLSTPLKIETMDEEVFVDTRARREALLSALYKDPKKQSIAEDRVKLNVIRTKQERLLRSTVMMTVDVSVEDPLVPSKKFNAARKEESLKELRAMLLETIKQDEMLSVALQHSAEFAKKLEAREGTGNIGKERQKMVNDLLKEEKLKKEKTSKRARSSDSDQEEDLMSKQLKATDVYKSLYEQQQQQMQNNQQLQLQMQQLQRSQRSFNNFQKPLFNRVPSQFQQGSNMGFQPQPNGGPSSSPLQMQALNYVPDRDDIFHNNGNQGVQNEYNRNQGNVRPNNFQPVRGGRNRLPSDVCFHCHGFGHW